MADEIKPLIQEDADSFERSLLKATPAGPPDGARERALAALGLSAATTGNDGPASTTPAPTQFFAAKWLVPLCLIVASSVAITVATTSTPVADAPPTASSATIPAFEAPKPSAGTQEPNPPPAVAAPAITPNSLPDAPPTKESPVASARRVAPAVDAPFDDALARETRVIDSARRAVASGEATRALGLLDEHDREFPAGVFNLDSDVLRIEALERAGRTADATQLGRKFLTRYPDGSYARRVRTALDRMASVTGAPTIERQ